MTIIYFPTIKKKNNKIDKQKYSHREAKDWHEEGRRRRKKNVKEK